MEDMSGVYHKVTSGEVDAARHVLHQYVWGKEGIANLAAAETTLGVLGIRRGFVTAALSLMDACTNSDKNLILISGRVTIFAPKEIVTRILRAQSRGQVSEHSGSVYCDSRLNPPQDPQAGLLHIAR